MAAPNQITIIIAAVITLCLMIIVAELGSLISLYSSENTAPILSSVPMTQTIEIQMPPTVVETHDETKEVIVVATETTKPPPGDNPCEGKKPDLPNVECVVDAIANVGPQAGANVTKGYRGSLEVDHVPITTAYWKNGMCPVNVHWHLGAEHYSRGEYDESGTSPSENSAGDGGVRSGFMCKHYSLKDPMFNTPYEWKHCTEMEVGQTYEVHWPHSAAGACGTVNQYQTPFYDGVFCTDGVLSDTAAQIGVQAQVFTVVNDESYYYPDLIRGMVVDGEMGKDIAYYTGSTTGTSRDNEICSQYSPITWQVDRRCHVISASSFDKLCADMKTQRDDMSGDLHPHGSRDLVDDHLTADNQISKVGTASLGMRHDGN